MSNILTRFADIMQSNIHALLDKAEDPAKMIDQYLRNMESDLGKVKSETAAVMAEEAACGRKVAESEETVAKFTKYAMKAVEAGNDHDAKTFLNRKNEEAATLVGLIAAHDAAKVNAQKMRSLHDKLSADILELQRRRGEIKAKLAVAGAQSQASKLNQALGGAAGNKSAFEAMEEKANRMIDEAEAMNKLNAPVEDEAEALARKYDEGNAVSSSGGSDVNDELAEMKRKLAEKQN